MFRAFFPRAALASALLCVTAMPAAAHGFVGSGWLHPLTGPDHILAMLAVGAWSAQVGGAALYRVPAAFLCAMAFGALVGFAGVPVPGSEALIAGSVLLLGLAVAFGGVVAWPLAACATAVFGFAHGFAHGAAIPAAADKTTYVAGILVTTACLHVAGAAAGLLLCEAQRGKVWLRLAGAATAIAGAAFVASTLSIAEPLHKFDLATAVTDSSKRFSAKGEQ